MKNYLIGTFHKTGTIWMMQVIYEFCKSMNYEFITVSSRNIVPKDLDSNSILFDYQSLFLDESNITKNLKGLVVIRHPKDQILSATRYHLVSKETWLNTPLDRFNGQTYQEKLNSFKTWREQVIFEMTHASRGNTISMGIFNDPRFIKIKYEDLVDGYPIPQSIETISHHLNFSLDEKQKFINAYQKTHMLNNPNDHILDGKTNQWKALWPDGVDNTYQRIYRDIESRLGYV